MRYNTAGSIHFTMDRNFKNEKKAMQRKSDLIKYLINKYNIIEGLAYCDPSNWIKKDQSIFLNIWLMSGYKESTIKRMYKLSI